MQAIVRHSLIHASKSAAGVATWQAQRTFSSFNEHVCQQRKDLHRRGDGLKLLLLGCCPGPRPDARVQIQPLSLHLLSMQQVYWEEKLLRHVIEMSP